ncbi:MAG: PDZ domain-containing protein [Bacteroidales bacterium]|nr:PDZ domain-containing protein [Candidatus Colimorpha onthohippi]
MNENSNYGYSLRSLFLMLIVGIILGWILGPKIFSRSHSSMASGSIGAKVESMIDLVCDEYVDAKTRDSLAEDVLGMMMSGLDPHCHYFSKEEIRRQSEEIQGEFGGIGAMLRKYGDTVCIVHAMPDGPAAAAGLRVGDRIVTVNEDTVSGVSMRIEDVISRIRGANRTRVSLGILRQGQKKMETVMLKRSMIPTHSILYYGMLGSKTGYINLSRFSETTYAEFSEAMEELRSAGMQKLVLDLRSNGGGVLEMAVEICNEFLKKGDLIVYAEGAHQRRNEFRADGKGKYQSVELVVLVDEFSASASEVVSGAVQDNDRGVIYGRRTFGKGLVQRQFDFQDGSAVWLTVARYYTPSGRCIQRPYNKGTDEYYTDFLNQLLEENSADSAVMRLTDTTRYYTQKGRIVYGGGGIYPDRLLPYPKDSVIGCCNQLVNSGVIDSAAYCYAASCYPQLVKQYVNLNSFANRFRTPDDMVDKLLASGASRGVCVKLSYPDLGKFRSRVETMFKACVAEYLYGVEGYYKVNVTIDKSLQSVLTEIK